MRRAFTVVATAVVAVGGFAGPASADGHLPLCQPNDGYIPGETCEGAVLVTPECVEGAPVLDYAVEPRAVGGAGTVDVTWTNLPGADIVLADQPLTGDDVAWPAGADADVTLVFATTPAETRVNITAPAECAEGLVLPAPQNPAPQNPAPQNPAPQNPAPQNPAPQNPAPVSSGVAATGTAPSGQAASGVAAANTADRARSQSGSGVLAATGSTALPLALGGGALIVGGAAMVLARRLRHVGAHRA